MFVFVSTTTGNKIGGGFLYYHINRSIKNGNKLQLQQSRLQSILWTNDIIGKDADNRSRRRQQRPRTFCAAVKELPWCAPRDSPNRRVRNSESTIATTPTTPNSNGGNENVDAQVTTTIIPAFGIIAAMCRTTRMIGRNGILPWNIPEDRNYFKHITSNRILIIGKNTLYEVKNHYYTIKNKFPSTTTTESTSNDSAVPNASKLLVHIAHTKYCIVISTKLSMEQIRTDFRIDIDSNEIATKIYIAKSFTEALQIANNLLINNNNNSNNSSTQQLDITEDDSSKHNNDTDNSDPKLATAGEDHPYCWVAGGGKIYEEAVTHPSAKVIHLTIVDNTPTPSEQIHCLKTSRNDYSSDEKEPGSSIAYFPAKYRWDRLYSVENKTPSIHYSSNTNIPYTRLIYRRKERNKKAISN